MLEWSYSFSIDMFGAFLLLLSCIMVIRKSPLLAGATFGMAVFGRMANAVTILAFVLYLLTWDGLQLNSATLRERLIRLLKFGLGGAPFALLLLASNYKLFGSPWSVCYDNCQAYDPDTGIFEMRTQYDMFSRSLLDGLRIMLFYKANGLFLVAPFTVIALFIGLRRAWRNQTVRPEVFFFLLVPVCLILFYSKYSTYLLNECYRYLIAPVCLTTPFLAAALEHLTGRCPRNRSSKCPR